MEFHESLSARLPAPRDDEPAGLRQDIVDELADHLACSANRELLRGADAATARARVLERFGDPAAVARRLWLDEMKGRTMAQRVVIVTCVLVAAASLAMVGLFWQQSVHAQRIAARQAAIAEAREREVLTQLHEMTEALRHPRSPDWNPVRIKVTEETTDGPPVAGATIVLTRLFENPPKTMQKVSDASGVADFGSVQPGDFTFQIFRNSQDWTLQTYGELNVQPGSDVTRSIVCPRTPPQQAEVRVRWNWPADLKNEMLCLYAPFTFRSRDLGSGNPWSMYRSMGGNMTGGMGGGMRSVPLTQPQGARGVQNQNRARSRSFSGGSPRHAVVCGPSTKLSEFLDIVPFFWTLKPDDTVAQKEDASKFGSGEWADVLEEDIREVLAGAPVEMETGHYAISELLVLRPSRARDLEPGQRRYEVLVAAVADQTQRYVSQIPGPADVKTLEQMRGTVHNQVPSRLVFGILLSREYWQELNDAFEARSGQPNDWTIPIPDELAQAVRDALKADKAPKAKPAEKSELAKGNG